MTMRAFSKISLSPIFDKIAMATSSTRVAVMTSFIAVAVMIKLPREQAKTLSMPVMVMTILMLAQAPVNFMLKEAMTLSCGIIFPAV